jgi:hypothetical protein
MTGATVCKGAAWLGTAKALCLRHKRRAHSHNPPQPHLDVQDLLRDAALELRGLLAVALHNLLASLRAKQRHSHAVLSQSLQTRRLACHSSRPLAIETQRRRASASTTQLPLMVAIQNCTADRSRGAPRDPLTHRKHFWRWCVADHRIAWDYLFRFKEEVRGRHVGAHSRKTWRCSVS